MITKAIASAIEEGILERKKEKEDANSKSIEAEKRAVDEGTEDIDEAPKAQAVEAKDEE